MSQKIVLVLTEEELEFLKILLTEGTLAAYEHIIKENAENPIVKLVPKLKSSKDKSFNFLYDLAETERETNNVCKLYTSWKYISLVNKFIQGE